MKRTRLDASAPIEQTNFALAAAVLGELRRKGVSGRSGEPVGAALLDGDTRAAARLPGRMERFDVEIGPRRLPVVMDGAHVPFNIGAVLRDLALPRPLRSVRGDRRACRRQGRRGFRRRTRPSAPRPWSSPICRDQAGAARRSNCRRLRLRLGSRARSSRTRSARSSAASNWRRQANAWLLITGSLYLIGALRGAIGEAAPMRTEPRRGPASVRGYDGAG